MPRSNTATAEGGIEMPLCKTAKFASKTANPKDKAAN
jgi:hypothetical protein